MRVTVIGEVTVGEVGPIDESVESSSIEVAVAVNELRGTAIIFHHFTVSTSRNRIEFRSRVCFGVPYKIHLYD